LKDKEIVNNNIFNLDDLRLIIGATTRLIFTSPIYYVREKERAVSWGKNHMVILVTLVILAISVMYWMTGGVKVVWKAGEGSTQWYTQSLIL
jgi:hypothetical protein